jgi:hypothetical protein|tara:strand:- start:6820 stop:7173 length:354 start_codon:yes stop_codon:yes gene_type:complete
MDKLTDTIKKVGLYNMIKSIGYGNMDEVLGKDFKPTKDMMINVLQEVTREYPHSFSYVINDEVLTITENHITIFTNFYKDISNPSIPQEIKHDYNDYEVNDYLPELYENVLDYMTTI